MLLGSGRRFWGPGDGWDASIRSSGNIQLFAPWSVKIHSIPLFVVSANFQPRPQAAGRSAASFSTAIRYLSSYCRLHGVTGQSQAALAAALLIPVANIENRKIKLPLPQLFPRMTIPQADRAWERSTTLPVMEEPRRLDRLLTLSCTVNGVKALLNSIFFEPGVASNLCGAWLQGSFAFLDTNEARRSPEILLRSFIKRDPGLGFLQLGAFVTGAQERCLDDARAGWWKVHLSTAAWTETHVSFIQDEVTRREAGLPVRGVSRADECRLTYLSRGPDGAIPPLLAFPPFGDTALDDTDLEVRRHVQCAAAHRLGYGSFTWSCRGKKVRQCGDSGTPATGFRRKEGQLPGGSSNIAVDYGSLDADDDEVSEMITRNVFTWLRGEDGFPVAERELREHEWIQNLDSDDDSPIDGDVRSVAGENLGRWLLGTLTTRSNSI